MFSNSLPSPTETFWCGVDGWREQQLPDGTLIVTAPTGHTYTTKSGSALEPKTSPNASKPNANSTTTTSPNATNPHRSSGRAELRVVRNADRAEHILGRHIERQGSAGQPHQHVLGDGVLVVQ